MLVVMVGHASWLSLANISLGYKGIDLHEP